ncbi:MAG: hypothetical protein ABEK50_07845 [bacterium]
MKRKATLSNLSLNGDLAVNYEHAGTDSNDNTTRNALTVEEAFLYLHGPVGREVSVFTEFKITPRSQGDNVHASHDETLVVDRAYLETDKLVYDQTLQAGIVNVFDGMVKEYHHSSDNPLPGNVVFFSNPWAHHDTLHDVLSEAGLKLSGRSKRVEYQFALTNGFGDLTPSRTSFDDANFTGGYGRLHYRPFHLEGLGVGVSYYNAEATADTQWGAPEDQYLIAELDYVSNSWQFRSLYLRGTQTRGDDTDGDGLDEEFENSGSGFVVEGLYNLTETVSSIARYQEINVDNSDEMAFFGVGSHHSIADVSQIEAGLNYAINDFSELKASWQVNRETGENTESDRGFLEWTASF